MAGKFRLFEQGDQPEWAHLYQVLGTFNGFTKWSRLLNATGLTDDSNFFFRLRNRGSGGKHQRWEKSTDGTTVATMTDAGLLIGPNSAVPFPVGQMVPYAGSSVPTGWLLCNGQAVSQTTYALLFAAISTTWNTGGEVAGTFRVPDMRGRFPIGVLSGTYNLGTTGGGATVDIQHTHGPGDLDFPHRHDHDHPLSDHDHTAGGYELDSGHVTGGSSTIQENLATITPEQADAANDGHDHSIPNVPVVGESGSAHFVSGGGDFNTTGATSGTDTDISSTQDPGGETDLGGSSSLDILPPYAAVHYIIWAGV
jgi:microcystin-dependent protein